MHKRLPIWDVLTGKDTPTNADIASCLINNVCGGTQTAAITNAAISAMHAETPATQGAYLASLASLAASAANQTHVDLVGVQTTGLVCLGQLIAWELNTEVRKSVRSPSNGQET